MFYFPTFEFLKNFPDTSVSEEQGCLPCYTNGRAGLTLEIIKRLKKAKTDNQLVVTLLKAIPD